MSESSYYLRPRIKVRSRSETRLALSHEPSPVTRSAVTRSILTVEKGPVPGQHPVPEVVGSVVAPLPGPEDVQAGLFILFLGSINYASTHGRLRCTLLYKKRIGCDGASTSERRLGDDWLVGILLCHAIFTHRRPMPCSCVVYDVRQTLNRRYTFRARATCINY